MRIKNLPAGPALALLLPCLLAGCYVKVDKAANGEDKDVEVRMPAVGVQVHQSTPSSAEIGIATYPGAVAVKDDKDHDSDSANIHLGFGKWQMTLKVAKYQTGDPQAKVADFYRSALGSYGQVIACRDGHAVGSPAQTREGLNCDDKHPGAKGVHFGDEDGKDLSLRAGSERHQHIVTLEPGDGGGTRFTLLRLDLPADSDKEKSGDEE